ncbi:hypothetical protein GH714_037146 [Hevea brasiliensis]|uniref:Uncharacterized protein n=1 Tax=Hevea brasiliensis TaxID=3981 RepID=A0A6A6KKU7_HEVBR|nr:hypothetical protein GH714_037146 [Hevea brasiliensis]
MSPKLCSKITKLEIPSRSDMYETFKEVATTEPSSNAKPPTSSIDNGYESAKDSFSQDDGYESAEDSFLTEEDFMGRATDWVYEGLPIRASIQGFRACELVSKTWKCQLNSPDDIPF